MSTLFRIFVIGAVALSIFGCEQVLAPRSRVERTIWPKPCQINTISPGSRVAAYTRAFVNRLSLEPEGEIHISILYDGIDHGKLRFTYPGGGHHLHPAQPGQSVLGHAVGFPYSIHVVAVENEELTYFLEPGQGCPELGSRLPETGPAPDESPIGHVVLRLDRRSS